MPKFFLFPGGTYGARNFEVQRPASKASDLPLPVVGTGVDPVTSRFSAALGTKSKQTSDPGIFEIYLINGQNPASSSCRWSALLRAVSRSVGHVWGTKRHTPYGYIQIKAGQVSADCPEKWQPAYSSPQFLEEDPAMFHT